MARVMGIDVGTASLKVLVLDEQGRVISQSARTYQFEKPNDGWAEQDGELWYSACAEAVREVLGKLPGGAAEVKSLALSGQMHGAVLLDKNMCLLRPVILHCDTRSGAEAAALKKTFEEQGLENVLYNPVYTGFLLPSLLWVREYEPAVYQKTRYLCLPKDYLRLRLTNELFTDFSDASGTLAFDVPEFCWHEAALCALDIPASLFPPCVESAAAVGAISLQAAADTGLLPGTLVAAGGADQVIQAIGNGAVRPGQATVNIGSSGQVCFQSDKPVQGAKKAVNSFCGFTKGMWITMGATMSAGLALGWFAQNVAALDYRELDRLALAVPVGSGGALFLPYLNGERTPHLNPHLRAAFLGLGFVAGRGEMARAVIEGVAFSLRECAEICSGLGLHADEFIASGGGAQSPLWLQIQADVYGVPLKIAECPEQAAFGAAVTAAVAAGFYSSIPEAADAMVRYKPEYILPDEGRRKLYDECFSRYLEAGRSLWTI